MKYNYTKFKLLLAGKQAGYIQEIRHEELWKPSTRGTEESGQECHLSHSLSVIASSGGPNKGRVT